MPWLHSLLYDDFAAYGIENFSFQILELCDEKQLDEREIYYIEKYNAYEDGLNSNIGNQPIYDKEAKKLRRKMYDQKHKERTQEKNTRIVLDFNWSPYFETPLFQETQDKICDELNLRNCNGRQIKFVGITNILIENGYKVEKVRRINPTTHRRQRATIISK